MEAEQVHGAWEPTRVPVYAVIRFDPTRADPEHRVMVWEVLTDIEEAESDVAHLNEQVPPNSDTTYFIGASCLYPEGRHAPRESWGSPRPRPVGRPVGPPAPPDRIAGEWGFLVDGDDEEEASGDVTAR